eukprot:COSAG02_NODE_966_length_15587_cov_19.602376_10_plen_204_part_00
MWGGVSFYRSYSNTASFASDFSSRCIVSVTTVSGCIVPLRLMHPPCVILKMLGDDPDAGHSSGAMVCWLWFPLGPLGILLVAGMYTRSSTGTSDTVPLSKVQVPVLYASTSPSGIPIRHPPSCTCCMRRRGGLSARPRACMARGAPLWYSNIRYSDPGGSRARGRARARADHPTWAHRVRYRELEPLGMFRRKSLSEPHGKFR